jgi:hypothetical protein
MFNTYSQSIEGDWYGKANIQGIELRLVVHVMIKTRPDY